jgi:RNA polymerase-binding transcription factor DksA
MAKSAKKKAAKPAKKKAVKKASAKKPAKAKKAVAKKVAKKAVAKKAAPKKQPKKAVKLVAKTVTKKEVKPVVVAAKPAPSQLNIFPIINQRPIAHKPAKPSTMSEDKTRYSDVELKEFEVLINSKLDKAREEFKILKETLNRNNDEGTDSTSGGNTKVLEDGAETAEKENMSQLAARQLKYIQNLENALVRIKNGTYGICSVTGKLISKERLIAVPHTTQSIEAKMMKQD